jgi:alkylation response protein AidB-like acyl-CoA dehydrogenase
MSTLDSGWIGIAAQALGIINIYIYIYIYIYILDSGRIGIAAQALGITYALLDEFMCFT